MRILLFNIIYNIQSINTIKIITWNRYLFTIFRHQFDFM